MLIPPQTIEAVRRATDLPALLREDGIDLRRQAGRYIAWCPFCVKPRTPAFTVYHDNYFCFRCQAHGGAIDWLKSMHTMRFADAVRTLADRAGIALTDKPVSRAQVAVDTEDRACAAWWWQERWDVVRAQLDAAIDPDPEFADVCGRLLRGIEVMSGADKLQQFRREVTSSERRAWREMVAWDKAFAAAWVGMAQGQRAA